MPNHTKYAENPANITTLVTATAQKPFDDMSFFMKPKDRATVLYHTRFANAIIAFIGLMALMLQKSKQKFRLNYLYSMVETIGICSREKAHSPAPRGRANLPERRD